MAVDSWPTANGNFIDIYTLGSPTLVTTFANAHNVEWWAKLQVWSCLSPLVWGWYAIGCHGRRDPVDKTINQSLESIRLPNSSMANPQYDAPPLSIRTPSGYVNKKHPNILGVPVCGDELKCGPFYNYVRCVTWSHVCQIVTGAPFSTRPIRVPVPLFSTHNTLPH